MENEFYEHLNFIESRLTEIADSLVRLTTLFSGMIAAWAAVPDAVEAVADRLPEPPAERARAARGVAKQSG